MKNVLKILFIISFGCCLPVSCKKQKITEDIYIVGSEDVETDDAKIIAKYWKNNEEHALTDGTNSANATAIDIAGNDIYISGEEFNGSVFVAKYWKNGSAVILSDGIHSAFTTDIKVIGNDVYVAGYVQFLGKYTAAYWKNGTATYLTTGDKNAYAYAIFIENGNVYVAGNEDKVAKYWKNNVAVTLSDPSSIFANAIDIIVKNNIVYTVGVERFAGDDERSAMFWKNDIATKLTSGNYYGIANSICMVNDDVFIAGSDFDATHRNIKYWKNNVSALVSETMQYDINIKAIKVADGNIYICGYDSADGEYETARYWKNNNLTNLTKGEQFKPAKANDIVVVKK